MTNDLDIWAATDDLKTGLVLVVDALSGIQLYEVDPFGATATALGALLRNDAPSASLVITTMLRGGEVHVIDAPDDGQDDVHPVDADIIQHGLREERVAVVLEDLDGVVREIKDLLNS